MLEMLGRLGLAIFNVAVVPLWIGAIGSLPQVADEGGGLAAKLERISRPGYRPQLVTRIYDRNGVLLTTLHGTQLRSRVVPLDEVPVMTRLVFVAAEDERFFEHRGLDARAILRAAAVNARAGRVVQGGSTITQQLVKNRFLDSRRDLGRKLQEMILANRMERSHTKEQILEQYLNEIYFGHGRYGIGSAARYYFGKTSSELSLAESALLAGMVKAPARYSPLKKGSAWKQRQTHVLNKMVRLGFISAFEASRAIAEEMRFAADKGEDPKGPAKAPFFTALVTKQLLEQFGPRKTFTGGLDVITSLDWEQQQVAEQIFRDGKFFKSRSLEEQPTLQGAFTALDPNTGDVLVMIGGRDFAKSQFNRAVQSRRQPGSAFKPFVYTAALLNEFEANHVIDDSPVLYEFPQMEEFWEPRNFGGEYHGPAILAKALAGSFNVAAVKLIELIGVSDAVEVARRMGIQSPLHEGLSLALGSSGVSLLELVGAYIPFAAEGVRATPRAILEVVERGGKVLLEAPESRERVLPADVAFSMATMLRGVVERGTARRARVKGHQVGGKTGTSNRYADAWFIGFTPDIVAGCYIGHDDNRSLGAGRAGGKIAAPIVGAYLQQFLNERKVRPFRRPKNVEVLRVCGRTGMLASDECDDRWWVAFNSLRAPALECDPYEHDLFGPAVPAMNVARADGWLVPGEVGMALRAGMSLREAMEEARHRYERQREGFFLPSTDMSTEPSPFVREFEVAPPAPPAQEPEVYYSEIGEDGESQQSRWQDDQDDALEAFAATDRFNF